VETRIAEDLIRRLSVKTTSAHQPVSAMSGGNAQKVVLARQLVIRTDLLVLAEPTQGEDVGAKYEIHRIMSDLADKGSAVVLLKTDLAEALRISDRVLVFRAGRVAAEVPPSTSQAEMLSLAAGQSDSPEAA